ncbi:MAG: hypothetical protein RIQ63_1074 [Actinomycetota bacterium]
MSFPSDLEIARAGKPKPLKEIAAMMGIGEQFLEPYGTQLAKISLDAIDSLQGRPKAKYVVVTAITPTPLGEGKTTTTVGLGQAMKHIGKNAVISLRQPSMGPTFGIKGGAAGGGYSQVIPMELLNLHLTGDFHAVTAAHNLLSAMVDNHLHQGNELDLDLDNITWRRVLDVNDRSLRNIIVGLGTKEDGVVRQTGFDITAASEVMAILALSTSMADMRKRFARIVVGYNTKGQPVTAEQLSAAGSMAVIMKDAIKPNLLQTLENTPVIVHAGPFGNIAQRWRLPHHRGRLRCRHGCGALLQHQVPCVGSRSRCRSARHHRARVEGALGQVQDRGRQGTPTRAPRRQPGRRRSGRREPAPANREREGARCHASRGDQQLPDRPQE